MNKKFLSVVLFGALMAGSSVTFTGCIDNDEPAGIETLRGAKAELLKAKAAVELANEAMVRAQVTGVELDNKAKEISNQMLEYQAAIAKAQSEKEIADLENAKALAAERFKAEMLKAEEATAYAQKAYDDAIKAIEASKLLLSDEEADVLAAAQQRVDSKAGQLASAHTALNNAAQALNAAFESTDPTATQAGLELEVAKAQVTLDAAKVTVSDVEEIIAKSINSYEGWEAEVKELEVKIAKQDTIIAQANIDKVKIQESQEGKDAADAVEAADKALTKATENKTKVYAGEKVDGTSYTFKLDKYSLSVASNKNLVEVLDKANTGDVATSAYDAGVFSYGAESYNQNTYVENEGTATEKSLEEMIALVNAVPGRAAEDLAWVNRELSTKEKALETAEKDYDATIEEWEKAVADYKNGKDYTEAQYKIARDKVLGVLTEVKAGKYEGTSDVIKEAQKLAYTSYTSLYTEMKNNGQNIPAIPSTVEDYASLFTYLKTNEATSLLPSSYTEVTEGTRKAALMAKSKAAFGDLYIFDANPRLTMPTASEIATEQAKIAKGEADYGNYAAMGAVWKAQDEVIYYTQIIEQADAIKELKATLVAQQTAVTEQIAANTTAVKAFDTALANAKADKKAKEDAEKALYADVNATIDEANATKTSYNNIKDAIEGEMSGIADGSTTVADVKKALAEQLNAAKKGVVSAEAALKDAQTKLDNFKAGKYDKAYEIEVLQAELERAQARFNEAQTVYNKALTDLNAVIALLVK